MDKLQAMLVFTRVVENRSFSATAKEFSTAQSAVSAQVTKLEKFLNTKLLVRTTRKLHLTESGEKFYAQAKSILDQFNFAVGEVKSIKRSPSGKVRLASGIFFGRKYIAPTLKRFAKLYPDIVIEHLMSDTVSDLIETGIDVSIRMGQLEDSTLHAKKLTSFKFVTVASKDFIKEHGRAKHPRDLGKVPCLIYLNFQNPFLWQYSKDGKAIEVKVNGPYRANVSEALREAAIAGFGVFRAPRSAVAQELRDGTLVQVLQEFEAEEFPVYAVTTAGTYIPQKNRVLIDFLEKEFQTNKLLTA